MTDREKLIEFVEDARQKDFVNCHRHPVCKHCAYGDRPSCHAALIADHLIANGVTLVPNTNVGNKWIPVTERLPTCGERVLVSVYNGAVFEVHLSIIHRWVRYDCFWIDGVTHWMPLPKPPEGE